METERRASRKKCSKRQSKIDQEHSNSNSKMHYITIHERLLALPGTFRLGKASEYALLTEEPYT